MTAVPDPGHGRQPPSRAASSAIRFTATVVGTMTGAQLAVAAFVNPILLRLPAGPSLEARADGARVPCRIMPSWYFGSLILTAGLAAVTRTGQQPVPPSHCPA